MNTVLKKAKNRSETLTFIKLGDLSDLAVRVYMDASFNNQNGQVGTTEGRVFLLENTKTKMYVLSFKVI